MLATTTADEISITLQKAEARQQRAYELAKINGNLTYRDPNGNEQTILHSDIEAAALELGMGSSEFVDFKMRANFYNANHFSAPTITMDHQGHSSHRDISHVPLFS